MEYYELGDSMAVESGLKPGRSATQLVRSSHRSILMQSDHQLGSRVSHKSFLENPRMNEIESDGPQESVC
jgi:hypothetical protein